MALRQSDQLRESILTIPPLSRVYYFLVWLISDAYILSYPRSGRTWLKVMLSRILSQKYNLKKDNIELFKTTLFTKAPNIVSEHFAKPDYPLSYVSPPSVVPWKFRNKKIILLFRDPRDLVVSNYYEYSKRKKIWQGELSAFIREPFTLPRIIGYMNLWHLEMKSREKDFLVLRYEQTKKDPFGELKKVTKFLEIDASDEMIEEAVRYGSVENMRKLEIKDHFKHDKLRPANPNDIDSYKVRKAKAGSYKEELNEEDIAYLNQQISEKLMKEIGY